MNYKKSIIITIIFLIVGGFYYFYEIKGKPQREEKKKQEETVFTMSVDDVKKLDLIRNFEGEPSKDKPAELSFVKKDNEWMMTKPLDTKADQGVLNGLAAALTGTKKDEIVEEDPKDVKKYNLDPPDYTAILSDGTKTETIELGGQTVDKAQFYARIKGQKPVFLTQSGFKHNLDKFLVGYRDKKIFDIKIDDVDKVAVHFENSTYIFGKKDDKWIVMFPPFPRPNSLAVENYVKGILGFQTSEFFEDNGINRKNQRLDKATDYVEFYLKDKKEPLVFRFSTPMQPEKFLYTMVEGRTELYGLQKRYYQSLELKPDKFFQKLLFLFDSSLLKSVTVETDGRKMELAKEDLKDVKKDDKPEIGKFNYKWVMTSPEKKDVDTKQLNQVINNIRNLYVQEALFTKDKLGEMDLEKPPVIITGKKEDGSNLFVLRIGGETKDKKSYYVMVNDEDTAETIQKGAIENLKGSLKSVLGIK